MLDLRRRQDTAGAIGELAEQRRFRQRIVRTAPERRPDALRDRMPVIECDAHLGAEMLVAVGGHLGMRRGMNALHELPRRGIAERFALEMLQEDAAMQ